MSTCQEIRGFVRSSPKRKSQQIIVSISGAILRGSWTQTILVKNASPPPLLLFSSKFVHPPPLGPATAVIHFLCSAGLTLKATQKDISYTTRLFDFQAMKVGNAFIRYSLLQAKVTVFTYKLPVSLSQRIFSLCHWSQQRRFCC